MFGKNKYVYTCPDTIHDHTKAKKRTWTLLAMYPATFFGLYVWSKIEEARDHSDLTETLVAPDTK